jgi:hypothetical protein
MNRRFSVTMAALAVAVAIVILAAPAFAQAPSAGKSTTLAANTATSTTTSAKKAWTPPKGPDGHADLSGVWTNSTTVPLERPQNLGAKEFYTPEEMAANAKAAAERAARQAAQAEAGDLAVHYDTQQFGLTGPTIQRAPSLRTSLIVGPEGRIPPLAPEATARQKARQAAVQGKQFDSYEYRPLAERCYFWGHVGPPMMPVGYNSMLQIVQGVGYVAIVQEMIHDTRIIPTDGNKAHLPSNIRQWLGDSRGHWEGDTLVVETTNFNDRPAFRNASENLKVIERFTRISEDAIKYEFTVEDPQTWTKPWSAEIAMAKSDGAVYEYACHEGNYGMANILSGARADEAAKAAGK